MHSFHPSYMFNAPEVNNEYNLLSNFLSNSLLDGASFSNDGTRGLYSDANLLTNPATTIGAESGEQAPVAQQETEPTGSSMTRSVQGDTISRPPSTLPNDKAQETYYMTAADPSGNDTPEERMNNLLQAKYKAGMLRPFNYSTGYKRLKSYMEQNMRPESRRLILRQLDKFRPKFRERIQMLTDMELVLVEIWFESKLMEYDRVFASMAIPACCWRRTGEIFRGNKEMAELIHVPIETLRDVSSTKS